jgi:hypothetical protein
MPKIKTQQDPFKDTAFGAQKIELDNSQCAAVEKRVLEAGGYLQFLEKAGAIKIRKFADANSGDDFVVLHRPETKGQKAAWNYTYPTEYPYRFWSDVLGQVEEYIKRREFAKKQEVEQLEALAKTSNHE